MAYNAIIRRKRGENNEILGRVLLKDLSGLPSTWQVKYRNRIIPKTTDLKSILCEEKYPLSVYTHTVEKGSFQITVKPTWGSSEFELNVCKDYKVEELKHLIYEMEGIPVETQFSLLNPDYRFESSMSDYYFMGTLHNWGSLEEYQVKSGSSIILSPTFWGGGSPLTTIIDVEAEQNLMNGNGELSTYSWEGLYFGLTMCGTCESPMCISRKIREGLTVYRAGYVNLRLKSSGRNQFICGACHRRFRPTSFIVSQGRALIRYRDATSPRVCTIILGGDKGSDRTMPIDYDVIEIDCVEPHKTYLVCVRCDQPIEFRKDAALYDCLPHLHPVHRNCMESSGDCGICHAESLTSENLKEQVEARIQEESMAIDGESTTG